MMRVSAPILPVLLMAFVQGAPLPASADTQASPATEMNCTLQRQEAAESYMSNVAPAIMAIFAFHQAYDEAAKPLKAILKRIKPKDISEKGKVQIHSLLASQGYDHVAPCLKGYVVGKPDHRRDRPEHARTYCVLRGNPQVNYAPAQQSLSLVEGSIVRPLDALPFELFLAGECSLGDKQCISKIEATAPLGDSGEADDAYELVLSIDLRNPKLAISPTFDELSKKIDPDGISTMSQGEYINFVVTRSGHPECKVNADAVDLDDGDEPPAPPPAQIVPPSGYGQVHEHAKKPQPVPGK